MGVAALFFAIFWMLIYDFTHLSRLSLRTEKICVFSRAYTYRTNILLLDQFGITYVPSEPVCYFIYCLIFLKENWIRILASISKTYHFILAVYV